MYYGISGSQKVDFSVCSVSACCQEIGKSNIGLANENMKRQQNRCGLLPVGYMVTGSRVAKYNFSRWGLLSWKSNCTLKWDMLL